MFKKIFLIIILLFSTKVFALEIESENAILYNLNDNSVIYTKNESEKVSIASLTKIVTAITVIENVDDLDSYVTITYDMLTNLEGYARLGLRSGNEVTVRELLYAIMLPSSADAAQSLAIYTSGSIEEFVSLMNKTIDKIGVADTKFDNPVGMDSEDNYSTASDLAKILIYALNNEEFKKIFNANSYYIESLNKKITKTLYTTGINNNLDTSIIDGAKTGYTLDAGLCLASTSVINGVSYMLIVLGAPTNYPYNITDTLNIYDYYSSNYDYRSVINKGDILQSIKIKNGKEDSYDVVALEDIKLYLEKEKFDNITYQYNGVEYISKKNKKGDKIGTIDIMYEDEVLYTYDIILNDNIEYKDYLKYIIFILFNTIVLLVVIKSIKKC